MTWLWYWLGKNKTSYDLMLTEIYNITQNKEF